MVPSTTGLASLGVAWGDPGAAKVTLSAAVLHRLTPVSAGLGHQSDGHGLHSPSPVVDDLVRDRAAAAAASISQCHPRRFWA